MAGDRWWAGLGVEEGLDLGEVGRVYTDGGGRYPADPRLRSCSWAVYANDARWISGTLPGEQQSVTRAELYAVYMAVLHTH